MKIREVAVLSVLLLLATPVSSMTQTYHASIVGRVADSSDLACPGVRVTVVNEDTGEIRRTTSDAAGDFSLPVLAPGPYRLEAEMAGFQKFVGRGIRLLVGQELRLAVTMRPGGPSEVVVVTVAQEMVRPDAMGLGAVIENRQIVNLPLDGRNFLQLSLLLPGTAPAAQGSPGSLRGDFSVNANGAREDSNNFILDGVFNNDPKLNTFAINPPVDAIREFEIVTSTYDASFGRSGGAQVNVVLQSGTNGFHGTLYEFFRNAALDARNYFAPDRATPPRYQRNQFGFSLGGPVRANRTFFFVDYEGRRVREGITQATNVPTDLERTGDFSQSLLPHPVDPYTGQPFSNNRISADRISAVGSAIALLYPHPNRAVPGQNYVCSPIQRDRDDRADLRIDHSLSAKSTLSGRYSFSDRDLAEPFSGPSFARVPGYGVLVPRRAQNLMISENHIFDARFANQLRAAFNRVASGSYQEARSGSLNKEVGLPELSSNPRDFGLSLITISGFSPLGDEYNNPQHSVTNVFQVIDNVTYTRGRHLVEFGAEFRALQQNAFRDVQSRGFLSFSNFGQVTGNGLADLLLGFVTYSGGARLDNPQYLRTHSTGFFVQDSFRWHRTLTLSMGLRYEYNSPPVDRYDRASLYDPATRALLQVGKDGMPRSGFDPDPNNWAPRIGLAWSPGRGNHSVIRAGYGIFYDQSSLAPGEGLYFNKPRYDFRLYFPLPGMALRIDNPFPANYPFAIPAAALGFDRNLRTPYMQQWSLSLQHQFGTASLVEIAYVGSKGTKILSARDLNQAKPGPAQPNPRPAAQFADITFLESRGASSYHSLQARFQQRLHAGLAGIAAYTFGKSLDVNSTFFSSAADANFPQNSADPGAEKGRSNFDARHRLSMGMSYDLPAFHRRRSAARSDLVSRVLSDWSAHGIVTVQSGRPFTVALLPEIDNSNTGIASLGFGANNRPNRIASGALADPSAERWFDTSAFAFAKYGSFGNSGRNILEGPGYADVSASMLKDSRLNERCRLQFRAEFFNFFNRVNFSLPDIFLGSPTFGRISSAGSPRRIQFGLKLIF
jgi:hypothetical protein